MPAQAGVPAGERRPVIPAKAGIPAGERRRRSSRPGTPTFAGATWISLAAALLVLTPAAAQLPAEARVTAAGIPLSAPWRAKVYAHAREKLLHPAWGWRHSERDFLIARQVAREEGLAIYEDVLFAAAFLHDAGAIPRSRRRASTMPSARPSSPSLCCAAPASRWRSSRR